ncbi:class D sortase, partial [Oscillospiraceae bacterium OttesenSCG-928-F05]|nr:class D sortase [Oscillospiraceae bacterium OttesenSCG-928-F05]
MKKLITTLTALLLTVIFCVPVLAYDVTVEGAEQHPFGKPTSTDEVSATPADTATITDKDAQLIAPAFGSASAHAPGTGDPLTPHLTETTAGTPPSVGNAAAHVPTTNSPAVPETLFTLPQFYSDGSMGRLQIPRIGVDAKIYETESLDSLAKGIGHFKTTSAWDGLVGLCAHNRGTTT